MGLDDFKEEPTDEYEELEEELNKNSPPQGNDSWREYEPGVPDWVNDVCGGEVSSENVEYFDADVIMYVRLDSSDKSGSDVTISSDKYISLDDAV